MDWIKRLTAPEARTEMCRIWNEREKAIAESDYDEVERLNLLLAAITGRIEELGGDVG